MVWTDHVFDPGEVRELVDKLNVVARLVGYGNGGG